MGNRRPFRRRVAPAPEPEAPAAYKPAEVTDRFGTHAGHFVAQPLGVILHGSRSGRPQSTNDEFWGTSNFAMVTELGWNATVGDDIVAVHLQADEWGWNARSASQRYLAVEFAQPTVNDAISDAQVRAFCHWFMDQGRHDWPRLPLVFPTHAELPEGVADGKTDICPRGDPRANDLRARIHKRLRDQYGVTA